MTWPNAQAPVHYCKANNKRRLQEARGRHAELGGQRRGDGVHPPAQCLQQRVGGQGAEAVQEAWRVWMHG